VKSVVLQCLVLLTLLLVAGSYAYGGDAWLSICNKGSVDINVVIAANPLGIFLDVSGWTGISPGECKLVYNKPLGASAYIGFGFHNSQKHFTAGHVDQVPDLGWNGFVKVLTRSDRQLCVRENGMSYRIRNDPAIDCASFHYGGNDAGGYFPFVSALYFRPVTSECSEVGFIGQVSCYGGEYYLNVKPTANDRDLHASVGSKIGKDVPSTEPSPGDQLMNELGKAAAEQRKRREEMQAEEAVQEKARAETSVRQNVCISDDLTTEWRNPPAGGKMDALKRLLIQSLRERAKTPGYDQTRWIAVDSHYYSAWSPGTSLGKLVSTIPGGSCGAAGHREILTLAP
jgi:uncharacterized protein DUF1036